MNRHKGLWSCFFAALLILALARIDAPTPAFALDATYQETITVSFAPSTSRFFVNILIPPDATVESCSLTAISGSYRDANFTYSGCFNLRCYKFAQGTVGLDYSSWPISVVMNVTLVLNRNAVQYTPCSGDSIADKVMERVNATSSANIFTPGLLFANLGHLQDWRGYPVLPVNKAPGYSLPTQSVDYLIIGSIDKFTAMYDLMLLKAQQGFNVFFMSTQDIAANYFGDSIQFKTIEFLKDAYNQWHMNYVLLVGNSGDLPPIPYTMYHFYVNGAYRDEYQTGDYYYSTLEQPPSEFSFEWPYRASLDFPDFILGRFPFDDVSQVASLVRKTVDYESAVDPGDWARKVLIMGGADASGQATTPDRYTNDRPKTTLVFPGNLTLNGFMNQVNAGVGSVVIAAHGSPYGFMVTNTETFDADDANALSNTKLPVIFTIGCHTGKFDAGTSSLQSIAVALLAKSGSGAVAMVSGTSYTPYGDYVYYSAYNYWNQSNYAFGRLVDANYSVGKALYYFCALDPIEYMILLGDPALELATARYDLPQSSVPPAPTPTMRPVPDPTPTPSAANPTPAQSSTTNTNTPQPTDKPKATPTPTPQPTQTPLTSQTPQSATPTPNADTGLPQIPIGEAVGVAAVVAVVLAIGATILKKRRLASAD